MDRTPGKGHARNTSTTPSKTPVKKGLFTDGIWKCNCDPRMPADHFQTKNGGPNHGRWFYTCQKPQPRRCGFFLWDSEAKPREARAVLSNSNTEPATPTEADGLPSATFKKESMSVGSPIALQSNSKPVPAKNTGPASRNSARQTREDDWLYVSDDDLDDATLRQIDDGMNMPPPDTPSKSVKNRSDASPSKRNHQDYQERSGGWPMYPKLNAENDLFTTPNERRGRDIFSSTQTHPQTRQTGQTGGLLSPGVTPATNRFTTSYDMLEKIPVARDESPTARKSTNILNSNLKLAPQPALAPSADEEIEMTLLATEILDALKDEAPEMTDNLVIVNSVKAISLKHTHDFNQMQKSRDFCRKLIEKQKSQIAQLKSEMDKLKLPRK